MPFQVFIIGDAELPVGEERVSIEADVLKDCANVEFVAAISGTGFDERINNANALIVSHGVKFDAATIGKLRRVRAIVRNGVGYDNVEIATAAANGIAVCNVPDYGTEEVADHALTLTLALVRRLRPLIEDVANGNWNWRVAQGCRRIRGQVLGVIGCGRIGTAMALRSKALGFRVLFYDPYVSDGYEKAIGIERTTQLNELLTVSDVISIHAPLTEQTQGLIGAEQFRQMKKSAFLVNTARGGIVTYDDFVLAMTERWIAGAALDVLEHEPEQARRLARLPNCILTPHAAFYSEESLTDLRKQSALIVRDLLMHGQYRSVVNGINSSERFNAKGFDSPNEF